MRLTDLYEAPITDFQYVDLDDGKGVTFTRPEQKSLTSPRGQQRYFNAFQKTPFNIKVTIVNNTIADAESEVDNANVEDIVKHPVVRAGIHDNFIFKDNAKEIGIDGEAGVIKIVLLSNLSPIEDRMPMTPWILAHKIGHSFQDQTYASGWKDGALTDLIVTLNQVLQQIGKEVEHDHGITGLPADRYSTQYVGNEFDYPKFVTRALTMRSARRSRPYNMFEVVPEVIAQYLITGRVTLDSNYPSIKKVLEPKLNAAVEALLKSVEGKVLVEV